MCPLHGSKCRFCHKNWYMVTMFLQHNLCVILHSTAYILHLIIRRLIWPLLRRWHTLYVWKRKSTHTALFHKMSLPLNCILVAYKNTVSLTFSVKPELVLILKQVFWSIENLQAKYCGGCCNLGWYWSQAHTELLAQTLSVFLFFLCNSALKADEVVVRLQNFISNSTAATTVISEIYAKI